MQCRLMKVIFRAALKRLTCSDNKLETLDVTHNTALQSLYCEQNKLATIDRAKDAANATARFLFLFIFSLILKMPQQINCKLRFPPVFRHLRHISDGNFKLYTI